MHPKLLQLADTAQRILADEEEQRGLFVPPPEANLDVGYERPSPEKKRELEQRVIGLCGDIAAAIDRVLTPDASYLFHPEAVAHANDELDAMHVSADPIFEHGPDSAPGLITEITKLFERARDDFMKMVDSLTNGRDAYFFDIRLHEPVLGDDGVPQLTGKTLLLDMEAWLEKMISLFPYFEKCKRLAREVGAQPLIDDFNRRDQEYRTLVSEESGLTISEVLSNAKILRDDFNSLLQMLVDDPDPVHLKKILISHYYSSIEMMTNPLIRSVGVIRSEREEPGLKGATYVEHLIGYLDLMRRITVAMGTINRTLKPLKLRKSA